MKKRLKNFLKVATTLIITTCLCLAIFGNKSNADAGYHSSYSGGSSSHSSSSHSSSSRSSSSYSSGSSYSGSSSGEDSFIAIFIVVAMIIIIVYVSNKNESKRKTSVVQLKNNANAINKIKEILPNFNETEFLQNGYNMFLDIEDAWMNFDMEKVHNIMTDEMFNMYESQLSSMEVKGEQNIMKDFKLKSSAITDAIKQNDNIEVKTQYIIEFYDYIIEKSSGKVLRGTSSRKIRMHYEFTFIMSNDENAKIDTCPNCGAHVDVNSAGTCEYCGSKIVGKNTNWVISKKVCLRQTNL